MIYIIKHDFDQSYPYYVRINNDDTFDEVYDLNAATKFNVKSEAQKWVDTYSKFVEYSTIVEFNKEVPQYNEWIKNGMIRRTLNCINRKVSRPYNNESLEQVIDWWIYQKHNDDLIAYEDYKTWPHLYSISKYLWDVAAYHSKDYKERHLTFELRSPRNGVFSEFQAELNKVIG